MSRRSPHLDPSDYSAGTPSGTTIFEVVSIEDPNKSGRVLVRPMGSMEQFSDPQQMQWIPMEGTHAPNKGFGFSGVPYEVGSRVRATNNGQQGWSIQSALPNTMPDQQMGDQHPEIRDEKAYSHVRQPGGKAQQGDRAQGSGVGSGQDHRNQDGAPGENADLTYARRVPTIPQTQSQETQKQAAIKAPASRQYLERSQARNRGKRQMASQYFGKQNMKELDKAMKEAGVPFEVPQSEKIIDELRKTAQSGQQRKAEDSVGGDGIIQAAISFASSFRSQIQKQNEMNKKNPLKEWLYQMYRDEKKKEPLDSAGKETTEYKVWETAKLKELNITL